MLHKENYSDFFFFYRQCGDAHGGGGVGLVGISILDVRSGCSPVHRQQLNITYYFKNRFMFVILLTPLLISGFLFVSFISSIHLTRAA